MCRGYERVVNCSHLLVMYGAVSIECRVLHLLVVGCTGDAVGVSSLAVIYEQSIV